ncbi:MAG TPA: branched-chain amino acid ABC transporter substrate-binding protein [Jatrophihabitans sp.]|nr:branched-chain amino acid ABC transporter substrate-binding protein [Jatrophihabitans sp.]
MNHSPSKITAIAVLAGAALVASACSSSGSGGGGGGGDAIVIGVPVPTSGDYASAGTDILHGAQLAAKKINSSGGINGKKIQIVAQDDACSAQTAAQAAEKLISQNIVAAAGGYCSTASAPELETFHRQGIPYVMAASTNPELTDQGFPEAFRTIGRDDEQGPFVAKFITGYLKAKRVAVGNDNSTYSKGLADSTVAALQKDGAQVVFNSALTPGQSDYSSYLTKVGQSHPDVFYYTGYFSEMGLLLKQAKQQGLNFTMMGGDANNDPTLIKTAGSAADGVLIDTAPLAQFLSSAKDYVQAYQSAYHTAPGPYSSYEYDAVGVLAEAIKNAGSTEGSKIDAALHAIKTYHGITGDFHFDSKGDRQPVAYIIITVKNGQFVADKQLNPNTGQWESVG